MKRALSLRTQIILLMTFLVVLINIALIMSLSSSQVYHLLDAESFRLFNNSTGARKQAFNEEIGQLIANVSVNAKSFGIDLRDFYKDLDFAMADDIDDESYNRIAQRGTEYLIRLLQNNRISGAFFVLSNDISSNMPSVYIRNTTPKNASSRPENFLLEVGPIAIAQNFCMPTSVNWSSDFPFQHYSAKNMPNYIRKPMEAANLYPRSEIERYGYWSTPVNILPDLQSSLSYTMPLLDPFGEPIGIIGIEISLNHFSQYYLPLADLPYQNSFYVITDLVKGQLPLDWFVSASPLAHIYLSEIKNLNLKQTQWYNNVFSSHLESLGKIYCFVQPLTIYSRNSPFIQESWYLVGFTPKHTIHDGSSTVRTSLTASIILTSILGIIAIFLMSYIATRKISGLSKYVAGLSPYQEISFIKTGMREIDELSSAVEHLNQSVIDAAKTTSKILELSLLPIGGFEVNTKSKKVLVTEYIYDLLGLEYKPTLQLEEWHQYYELFTQEPAPEYDNIYHFYSSKTNNHVWLRILVSNTSTGYLGVILDVTRDVEEHRRLLHELDYDNMTHLYNRKSFKREVHSKISREPDKIGVMLFSDLDNLKYINDTFGHDIGDKLILRAGDMFRQFNLYGGIVARISGDEFAIYLHGFSSKEEARKIIMQQFRSNDNFKLVTPDGVSHRIRSSTGLSWYPADSANVTDLLKLADFAMYEAKQKEKGSLLEFNKVSYETNAYLLENREAIHRLIDESLIYFCFQPIISLSSGRIYAYEALMRPALETFKSPIEILSVASAQSQLGQLERLVFATAFEKINKHIDDLRDVRFFINSIPSHFLSQEDFKALETRYRHLFSQIVIEVTERESDSLEQAGNPFDFVRNLGIKLALDDFGNGYSSEVRILTVKPDIVKIDMMLIQGIHDNRDKQQLVANLVSYCHSKGVKLVAEGVEIREDLVKLIELDVDFVQGYYTGKPNVDFEPVDPAVREEILEIRKSLLSE